MSSFLKHAAGAASALSKTALQHRQQPQPHSSGTELAQHNPQVFAPHRPQLAPHSSSQFSQSPTASQQQQQIYQQSTQSPYGGSNQYSNDPNYQQQQGYQPSAQPQYGGGPYQYSDPNYQQQQQQGYQQSYQPQYGAPNQSNFDPNYQQRQQQQQQQYNQNAQAAADQQAANNALLGAQLSAATAPQPPYNPQGPNDYQVSPVGSSTDPNAVVADPGNGQVGSIPGNQQDYASAGAYQVTPTTTDPSTSATQGDQMASVQPQQQPAMDTSAGSVRGDDQMADGGYQPTSAMDATTTSALPDQTAGNDNSGGGDDDGGCWACLWGCFSWMCCS